MSAGTCEGQKGTADPLELSLLWENSGVFSLGVFEHFGHERLWDILKETLVEGGGTLRRHSTRGTGRVTAG